MRAVCLVNVTAVFAPPGSVVNSDISLDRHPEIDMGSISFSPQDTVLLLQIYIIDGDTYVEIDMGEQMMYYYLNGELQIETPVVTGNTSRRMGTPSGVNYVYLKQQDLPSSFSRIQSHTMEASTGTRSSPI